MNEKGLCLKIHRAKKIIYDKNTKRNEKKKKINRMYTK